MPMKMKVFSVRSGKVALSSRDYGKRLEVLVEPMKQGVIVHGNRDSL